MLKKDPWEGYVRPGKIFGNLYFVGTRPASSHLIDTGEGLILIDSGYQESLYMVLESIWEIGFDPRDIRYIVLSHAHSDHMDATKALVKMTGAKTFISKADLPLLTGKLYHYPIRPFEPDVLLEDGDTISLGNTHIKCVSTPGHTDGTMSFFFDVTDGKNTYRAGMHGGVGLNTLTADFLTSHALPFENRQKYLDGLERAERESVDIFIGNHVGNNDTIGKLKLAAEGVENPFLDPTAWKQFLQKCRDKLTKLIEQEKEEQIMQNTIRLIEENKIIVIVRGVAKDKLIPLVQAMYDGGIRLVECTYDSSAITPDEEIAGNIQMLAEHFGDKMAIGAGTVLNARQVELTKKAGGKFIISPDTDNDVIAATKACGMVSIPGAISPTEVAGAVKAGADFVKVFPIDLYGPKYLRILKAPLSHARLLAVNGITAENMNEYLEAGACGVGVGSGIVNKQMIADGDFAGITALAKKYTENC